MQTVSEKLAEQGQADNENNTNRTIVLEKTPKEKAAEFINRAFQSNNFDLWFELLHMNCEGCEYEVIEALVTPALGNKLVEIPAIQIGTHFTQAISPRALVDPAEDDGDEESNGKTNAQAGENEKSKGNSHAKNLTDENGQWAHRYNGEMKAIINDMGGDDEEDEDGEGDSTKSDGKKTTSEKVEKEEPKPAISTPPNQPSTTAAGRARVSWDSREDRTGMEIYQDHVVDHNRNQYCDMHKLLDRTHYLVTGLPFLWERWERKCHWEYLGCRVSRRKLVENSNGGLAGGGSGSDDGNNADIERRVFGNSNQRNTGYLYSLFCRNLLGGLHRYGFESRTIFI